MSVDKILSVCQCSIETDLTVLKKELSQNPDLLYKIRGDAEICKELQNQIRKTLLQLNTGKGDVKFDKLNIDPTTIVDRITAIRYVTQVIMPNKQTRLYLAKLKQKQHDFEIELYEKRQLINKPNKSQILQKLNTKAMPMMYKEYDTSVLKKLQNLYSDYHLQFRKLKIPFFCLRRDLYYDNYKQDRKFIINLINDMI